MAIGATVKPWLRYDLFGRVSTSDALAVALLATAIKLAQYPKPLFAEQSLHLQAGAGAQELSTKKEHHRYGFICRRARH